MNKSHSLGNLVGCGLIGEVGQDGIGIREGSSRSFACGDIAIDGDEVACIVGRFQHPFETRIAGGLLAIEETQLGQYDSWRGTDSSDLLARSSLQFQCLTDTLVLKQIAGAWHTAWQHQQVGIGEITGREHHVGTDAHTMC